MRRRLALLAENRGRRHDAAARNGCCHKRFTATRAASGRLSLKNPIRKAQAAARSVVSGDFSPAEDREKMAVHDRDRVLAGSPFFCCNGAVWRFWRIRDGISQFVVAAC